MVRKLVKIYNELYNLSSFCELCQLAKLKDGCLSHYSFMNGDTAELMINNQRIWIGSLDALEHEIQSLKTKIDKMK